MIGYRWAGRPNRQREHNRIDVGWAIPTKI